MVEYGSSQLFLFQLPVFHQFFETFIELQCVLIIVTSPPTLSRSTSLLYLPLLTFLKMYFSVCVCLYLCGYVHMNADTHGSQMRSQISLELELQSTVSQALWVTKTELWSSGRAVNAEASLQAFCLFLSAQSSSRLLLTRTLKGLSLP